ncbi:MAG: hypothetical protein AMXMBFR64_34770 [Myxococcales bacterium]
MALSLQTNVASIGAQNNLRSTQRMLDQSIARLSSGLRVRSARDDAAGLAVSENLRAQLKGYNQAIRNANDGVSMAQTAEGAHQAVSDILVRMRELAVQASSDGIGDSERAYLNTEFTSLYTEINRIANVTEFNGIKLTDGTDSTLSFQIGTRNSANDQITLSLFDLTSAGSVTGSLFAQTISAQANAFSAISVIDTVLNSLNDSRAKLGSVANQLTVAIENLGVTIENLSAANSQIRDSDVAQESANFARAAVLQQAGVSMLAQANAQPNLALRLLG